VAAVLRFWRLGAVALIGDESYYWLWSERIALSYFDNPAGVALLVRASTALAGQSEIGVRWLNAFLGVGAVFLAHLLGSHLYSRRAGALGAAFLAVGAPYIIVSRFVYTDALQITLLLLNLVLLAPLVVDRGEMDREGAEAACVAWASLHKARARDTWRFWAVGLSMAALFNTKYNAYLYALAIVAVLLWHRRDLFVDRRTWLAICIALCGLLPVLLWNASHGWVSFRWQFRHFGTGTAFDSTLRGRVSHALLYLTPPLALLGMLGATRFRGFQRQLLLVPALVLALPILLGPADSPRNLLVGLALLLVLAGDALDRGISRGYRWCWAVGAGMLLWASAYGLGTVLETLQPSVLPSSSVARAMRVDGTGWRTLDTELEGAQEVFAVDYGIASQLRYYTGRPVHTSWGQYRLWGIPVFCGSDALEQDVRILALGYVDPDSITQRLKETFLRVQGPVERQVGEGKLLYAWTVRGCTVDQDTFLDRFDLLSILQAGDEH
jgi:4-amino-4-deoxy-L-arabinose transferase-like glycosyltransferase